MVLRISLFFLIIYQCSCNKYLDKKPVSNLAVPSSLNDLEALLNNSSIFSGSPGYLEFVADNYYVTYSTWNGPAIQTSERLSYIWDKNAPVAPDIWSNPYEIIYRVNIVLDNLKKVSYDRSEAENYNHIKGKALFYRSFLFHQLAQLFCRPYSSTAQSDPGIVLRLTSEIKSPSVRATVQDTYDQIFSDLKQAVLLLPFNNAFTTHPNKAAGYGMLARVYLFAGNYSAAAKYADTALQLNSTLLDYNSLSNSSLPAFSDNPEISFFSLTGRAPYDFLGPAGGIADSLLFNSYDINDLRKTVFWGSNGPTKFWNGSYLGNYERYDIFDGMATDELYLIRAECRARLNDKDNAMADVNTLLVKRYKTGTFSGLTATDAADALNKVLAERRKELPFRGLRWSDCRRLNLEGANITLRRIINGVTYTLPPNDLRWVLLIPDAEITRAGIAQNPR
jgi:starch-binding outer membrane protein, SusD/RagB family